jgi:hypothetical protein
MAALGRKGGLRGGPARARALEPSRRAAIARQAARARWSKPVLAKDARPDLAALVAYGGSSVAHVPLPRSLEKQVMRAVSASRHDSALARMLPVFLWRSRRQLDMRALVTLTKTPRDRASLGFFLEITAKLGRTRIFDEAILRLRATTRTSPPWYFFLGTEQRPFERAAADHATSAVARHWGLLMNMPWESFASYFEKAAPL